MQRDTDLEATLVAKFVVMAPRLDERGRRLWAAAESAALGYGGDAVVSSATGLARQTIRNGRRELAAGVPIPGRIRRPGAGRPGIEQIQPGLTEALVILIEPATRGDPMSPLRWTCKSTAKLAGALTVQGWPVSASTVGRLLHGLGFRLHALQKAREGTAHPDRTAQFEHINATAATFMQRQQPVIAVDTKKKELVGDFKNAGREWQPTGCPERVRVHDFPGDAAGKAIPYGVYDMARNEAWVSVGRDHDTPAFAVARRRRAWTLPSLWTRRTRPQVTWKTAQNAVLHSAHTHYRGAAGLTVICLSSTTLPFNAPIALSASSSDANETNAKPFGMPVDRSAAMYTSSKRKP